MYSEILILAMLRQRPQHGYEIKKSIEQVLGGTVVLNNKVLYPALKHFEEMGAVVREVVQQEGKPNRHIYQLTERGIELLQAYLSDFPSEQAGNEAEFLTRVAFFHFLEPEERREILKKRLAYLQDSLEHLDTLQQMIDEPHEMMYAQRVLTFHIEQTRNEYQWVTAWLEEMQANS
jgi:DNA-binding PadR family transcriptional regulator